MNRRVVDSILWFRFTFMPIYNVNAYFKVCIKVYFIKEERFDFFFAKYMARV